MNRTSIEWCTHTVNPIRFRNNKTGKVGHYCEKISPGCKNCYASRMQTGPYLSGLEFRVENRDKGELFFDEAVLAQVLRRRKPAVIFWSDMTDLFGEWVPDEWIDRCAAVVALTPHLKHLWLTKRAGRMREWAKSDERVNIGRHIEAFTLDPDLPDSDAPTDPDWPFSNLGLGVSVEDQQRADERIPDLLETPAAMRFVSVEPMLAAVDINSYLPADNMCPRCGWVPIEGWERYMNIHGSSAVCIQCGSHLPAPCLDWAICGGESGPGARPMHPDWVRSIRDQSVSAGVPFLFKQWGGWEPCDQWPTPEPGSFYLIDKPECCIDLEGHIHESPSELPNGWKQVARVGKKAAGRLLDGREWDERPEGWR